MTEHELKCESPLCTDCKEENIIWYPREKICSKSPMGNIQKKQKRINEAVKLGKFKNEEIPLTYLYLKTHSF